MGTSARFTKRLLFPIIVLVAGVAISVALSLLQKSFKDDRVRSEFFAAAKVEEISLKREIASNLDALVSIKAFFDSSNEVERSEFRSFVTPLLSAHPTIQALEWIPRVRQSERLSYEAAAQVDGLAEFQFVERKAQGAMVRADVRPEYFPVYFVEPEKGNEAAVGFDLGSNPKRLTALEQARDLGHAIATSRITLVQETASQAAILIFIPVYRDGPKSDAAQRRNTLTGFALGVYRVGDLVVEAGEGLPEGVHVRVLDKTDAANPEELFTTWPSGEVDASDGSLEYRVDLSVADRTWELIASPVPGFFSLGFQLENVATLVLGFAFTILLSFYIWKLLLTNETIAVQVDQQTRTVVAREKELRAQQQLYEDVVQQQREIVHRFLPDTTITFVNEAYCTYYGKTRDELLGTKFVDLVPAHERDDVQISLARMGANETSTHEREDTTYDGNTVWLQWHRIALEGPDGSVSEIQAVGHDITELKEREAELEQFAYVASHDLQEPLRMVSSYCELIKRRYNDQLDDEGKVFIDYAVDGATRMQALIGDLLRYSRTGRGELVRVATDLNGIVGDIRKDLQTLIEEAGATLSCDELPTVMVEPSLIRAVLQNLIVNAIKFRAEQPPKVSIEVADTDPVWLFSVADNGIGIEAQYSEKIFELFQRLHGKSDYKGTGMGLAIARRIIERHRGQIWLDTSYADGTRFYFTLSKVTEVLSKGAS